jgi:hypothetical protein
MDKFKKHIISTPEHQVWLHRTTRESIENTLKKGLKYGSGDLSSTATLQSSKQDNAISFYNNFKDFGNSIVVIKIPRQIAQRDHNKYDTDKRVTYFEEGNFIIQRQHIHGWIDRETDEYHPNPYLNEPQKLKDTHFPNSIYGELEKKVIKKQLKRTTKNSPNKKELPAPPSEIIIG